MTDANVGAPYIERVRKNVRLGAALSAITAAVVGVVLNLSVIFTYHVLFPEGKGFDLIVMGTYGKAGVKKLLMEAQPKRSSATQDVQCSL